MLSGEQIFARADASVRIEILAIRSDLKGRWRPVVPKNLGIELDDWLLLSKKMVTRFAKVFDPPVSMSAAVRAQYHEQRLIEFVVALANLGDGAMQVAFPANFKVAGT